MALTNQPKEQRPEATKSQENYLRRCPDCGAVSPRQDATCWNCQRKLSDDDLLNNTAPIKPPTFVGKSHRTLYWVLALVAQVIVTLGAVGLEVRTLPFFLILIGLTIIVAACSISAFTPQTKNKSTIQMVWGVIYTAMVLFLVVVLAFFSVVIAFVVLCLTMGEAPKWH